MGYAAVSEMELEAENPVDSAIFRPVFKIPVGRFLTFRLFNLFRFLVSRSGFNDVVGSSGSPGDVYSLFLSVVMTVSCSNLHTMQNCGTSFPRHLFSIRGNYAPHRHSLNIY